MNLKFTFGTDFELSRVKDTLAKLDWYDSKGYKPRFPKGIIKESLGKEIQNQIKKEFKEDDYKAVTNKISSNFSKMAGPLSDKLKEVFNGKIPKEFIVYLTNYGVGGSYKLPNMIILNINRKNSPKIIVHEIIHLAIEDWIKKYKIQHWEKERIVDLILNSKEFRFLNHGSWQKNYGNVERYIDNLFNKYFFKNPEDFFSKIESLRISNN